jgi:hypothetical protein
MTHANFSARYAHEGDRGDPRLRLPIVEAFDDPSDPMTLNPPYALPSSRGSLSEPAPNFDLRTSRLCRYLGSTRCGYFVFAGLSDYPFAMATDKS